MLLPCRMDDNEICIQYLYKLVYVTLTYFHMQSWGCLLCIRSDCEIGYFHGLIDDHYDLDILFWGEMVARWVVYAACKVWRDYPLCDMSCVRTCSLWGLLKVVLNDIVLHNLREITTNYSDFKSESIVTGLSFASRSY